MVTLCGRAGWGKGHYIIGCITATGMIGVANSKEQALVLHIQKAETFIISGKVIVAVKRPDARRIRNRVNRTSISRGVQSTKALSSSDNSGCQKDMYFVSVQPSSITYHPCDISQLTSLNFYLFLLNFYFF